MTALDTTRTMADLALSHHALIREFESLGLDYCCGGQRTLLDAITTRGLDPDEVLPRLEQAMADAAPGDLPDFAAMSMSELIKHILDTHHRYMWTQLPEIDGRLRKVIRVHGQTPPEILNSKQGLAEDGAMPLFKMLPKLGEMFFVLRNELELHLRKEEQILFPGLVDMENSPSGALAHCGGPQNPIRQMLVEHDDAGNMLRAIRALTNDYTPPEGACTTFKRLFLDLKELEEDLHQHIHLENNVLFPKALEAVSTGV